MSVRRGRPRGFTRVTGVLALCGAALLLTACGVDRESLPSPTRSFALPSPTVALPTAAPSRTVPAPTAAPVPTEEPVPLPTVEPVPTEEPVPLPTVEPVPTEEPVPLPTVEPAPTPTAEPTPTPSLPAVAEPEEEATTGQPAWLWWVLAAVAVALAVAIPLVVGARRRMREWNAQLSAAAGEVRWFSRELIPLLQQQTSVEQVAGAWLVARSRVAAVEDALTSMVPAAPNETEAARAEALRDAVRDAREQLNSVTEPGAETPSADRLAAAAGTLESALAALNPEAPVP